MDNYGTESLLDVSSYHYSNNCLMEYVSSSNKENNADINNTFCGSLLKESVDTSTDLDTMCPLPQMLRMSAIAAGLLDEEISYRDTTPLVSTTPVPTHEPVATTLYCSDDFMDTAPVMDYDNLTPNLDTTLQGINPTIHSRIDDNVYQQMVADINSDNVCDIVNTEQHQQGFSSISQCSADLDNTFQDITPTLSTMVNDSILRDMVNDLNSDSCSTTNFKSPQPVKPKSKSRGSSSKNKTVLNCSYCGKKFTNQANLKNHLRVHSGERPYSCNICHKSFAQSATLKTHARTHTGEKPFSCEFCRRGFSDYSTYSKHVRTHTGDKPYKCDTCPAAFAQSGNLNRHQKIHLKGSTRKSKFMR